MAKYLNVQVRTVRRIETGESPAKKGARLLQRRYGGRITEYEYEPGGARPRETHREAIARLDAEVRELRVLVAQLRGRHFDVAERRR